MKVRSSECGVRNCGFTFVELLIAATMISILFVGLGAHLRGGVRVWRQVTEATQALQHERVALEQLARDFANAFVFDDPRADVPAPTPYFGASELAWFTVGPGRSPTVAIVAYQCADAAGEPWLLRMRQSVSEARAQVTPEPERILPGCRSLSAQYAYLPPPETTPAVLEWKPTWPDDPEGPFKLPRLVEVTLELKASEREASRRLRRIFAIPAGRFGQPEGAGGSS